MQTGHNKTRASVRIRQGEPYTNPVRYVLQLIAANQQLVFYFRDDADARADLDFDHTSDLSGPIALDFYAQLRTDPSRLSHESVFKDEQVIRTHDGKADLIATIFYMVNCLQEHAAGEGDLDQYGRFKYTSSYQYRFGSIEENLVQRYIDALSAEWGMRPHTEKSKFFISHDIDALYGSFVHDGLWAIKRGRIDVLFRLVWNVLVQKPEWRNIDRILKLNDAHNIKSTFFWIVNRGRDHHGIKNADYNIDEERDLLALVEQHGSANGLHKSTLPASLDEELALGKLNTNVNRYHYLKHLPARDWPQIQQSGIRLDASLGFAEHCGFRNSYGRAFQPYNIVADRPFDFVVIPLHMMDETFIRYMQLPRKGIGDRIVEFYQSNAQNCVLSVLWHNTHFTHYIFCGMSEEYLQVAQFIYENDIECVLPEGILAMTNGSGNDR